MTTSRPPQTAFVWAWLPGAADPVVAGRIDRVGERYDFTYGRSYLERPDAIPVYEPELPLRAGAQAPPPPLDIAGCLADASPDSWGQRVILARRQGRLDRSSDTADLDRLTYLLESGSNRIGGLDFQYSPTEYVPRTGDMTAPLDELLQAADLLQAGEVLSDALAAALVRGTSIGGARPKALLDDGVTGRIAKFSSTTDPYPVVKAEGVAMELARRAGVTVAPSSVIEVAGRDVLLVDRFDRTPEGTRRMVVSALTMLGLSEMTARYATYPELADIVRARFDEPTATAHELFRRIVVNVAIGNIDDHARNHAAFWNGERLALTPAYDLCPQLRSGNEVTHAMAITRDGDRRSRFAVCRAAAGEYLLSLREADAIIEEVRTAVHDHWHDAADLCRLTASEKQQLWGRQILNESIDYSD
jgi:serine/threonine-protein kinase HipA